jgi:hypothetical protein
MLSKCANPSCSTPLIYLREGKIFMMEQGHQPEVRPQGPVLVKSSNRIEHFWLCGPCASEMTLIYDRENGVKVMPKPTRARIAAAAS